MVLVVGGLEEAVIFNSKIRHGQNDLLSVHEELRWIEFYINPFNPPGGSSLLEHRITDILNINNMSKHQIFESKRPKMQKCMQNAKMADYSIIL